MYNNKHDFWAITSRGQNCEAQILTLLVLVTTTMSNINTVTRF